MKEIPVTGFMVHSPDSIMIILIFLYLTTWDGRPLHKHNFSGVTHLMLGMNIDMLVRQSQHPQEFHIPTNILLLLSLDDGHKHEIRGVTGPAIPITGGGHYHKKFSWSNYS